jgi:hypothetical protein
MEPLRRGDRDDRAFEPTLYFTPCPPAVLVFPKITDFPA